MELYKSGTLPPEILQEVRKLHFYTSRLADEGVIGQYRSAFRGRGVEFEEVRNYYPGDDIRCIDWKVTARSGAPFVKLFREERELTVMLAVDVSRSTLTGSKSQLRANLMAQIGALLTLIALRNNDKVGLVTFTDKLETYHPPRKARSAVWRILHEVLSPNAEGRNTNLAGFCNFLIQTLKRPAIVFLISDFMCTPCERELAKLAQKHDVTAVLVKDPLDTELPNLGLLSLCNPETGQTVLIDSSDPKVREFYLQHFSEHRQSVLKTFNKHGIGLIELETNRPLLAPVQQYFLKRRLMRY